MKLIALYKQPTDPAAFDAQYADHIKLVAQLPGLSETRLTRFTRTLAGDGFYLMAEMIFPDADTYKSAMRSPEMKAVGDDINRFAGDIMTLLVGRDADA